MLNSLGYSVYLSSFDSQREFLSRLAGSGAMIFISLHVKEEFDPQYCRRMEEICRWLSDAKFQVIADISGRTLEKFGSPDLPSLAKRLGLWALRIDYGLSEEETISLTHETPIVVNATTVPACSVGKAVMAMHNFYPRPETGLDAEFFDETTKNLKDAGLKVLAFIPGEGRLRAPLHQGLPTLEEHRGLPPSVCYAELRTKSDVDGIFVGDPFISEVEQNRISRFCKDGVLEIPADLNEGYQNLYEKIWTCRPDSPSGLIRVTESREYSSFGAKVAPERCPERTTGSITIDNEKYERYSGEIQITRRSFPADERVNVIGQVHEKYLRLLGCVGRGKSFALVRQ